MLNSELSSGWNFYGSGGYNFRDPVGEIALLSIKKYKISNVPGIDISMFKLDHSLKSILLGRRELLAFLNFQIKIIIIFFKFSLVFIINK